VLQAATDDTASGISFGVSLRLTPTLWPVQQGRPCQELRYRWYSSQGHRRTQTSSPR